VGVAAGRKTIKILRTIKKSVAKLRLPMAGWLLVLALASPAGAASPFADGLEQAAQNYERDPRQSLQALRQAIAALWSRLPLGVEQWRFLQDVPTPGGSYQVREDKPFAAEEPVILYLEPIGFTVREEEGLYNYHLAIDFNMVDAWGHVVGGRRQFSALQGPALTFPDHLSLVISYSLLGLTPGEYRIETTLRDMLKQRAYTLTTPLRLAAP
jgi:hypothetical protein